MNLHELKPCLTTITFSNVLQDTIRRMKNGALWKLNHQGKVKDFVQDYLQKLPPDTDPDDLPTVEYKSWLGVFRIVTTVQFTGVEQAVKDMVLTFTAITTTRRQASRGAVKSGTSQGQSPR